MLKLLIQYSPSDQRVEEYSTGGGYGGPKENILWSWPEDGELTIAVNSGHMERQIQTEPLKDDNGKQIYKIVAIGEHKTKAKRVPVKEKVAYLVNRLTEKRQRSKQPPTE